MIHPSAIIHPDAKIGSNISVGAFSIIDANVTLEDNCTIDPHVWLTSHTYIGQNNHIGFGSHIGGNPQDSSFNTSINSGVTIGDNNTIREHVTIHRSTNEGGQTIVGHNNMLMVNSHLAHDVQLGNNNHLANAVLIAGHIHIGNNCFLGGGAGFHQFLKIGDYAICQGNAAISKDIPPYCMAHGQNQLAGLNVIGLRRAGLDATQRKEIKSAYNLLFKSKLSMSEALEKAEELEWSEQAQLLINAAKFPSRKGIMMT